MTARQVWSQARCVVASVGLLVVVGSSVYGDSIVVDDFKLPALEDPYFFMRGNNLVFRDATLIKHIHPGILGTERDLLVEMCGYAQYSSSGGAIGYDGTGGLSLFQVRTSGNSGTVVALQYDGQDDLDTEQGLENARGLSVDLRRGGTSEGFLFRFAHADGADPEGLDLSITVTGPVHGTIGLKQQHYIPNQPGPFVHFVDFQDFTNPGVFDNVDSLTFVFNGDATPDADYQLDAIEVVPEPSTLALLGLGLLIMLVHGWRRQERQNIEC